MKNIVLVIILSFVLFSCTKEEELNFSCNPEIDAIVKSGVIEFSEIGLSELLEYDIELQKAIFRSFSADKKRDFWLEKLDSVVNTGFNLKEIEHVEKLVGHITTDYFAIKLDSLEFSNRKEFENEWVTYAKNDLLWDESKIHFIVSSLCVTESQYSQVILELEEITLIILSGNCTCSTESDYCSDFERRCEENGCQEEGGCGWLWDYTCNGNCL
ncbi:MAG: bacteriocin fulvocin C-related protein [Bacteroidetes bacterium]|nr:bacteriocin fulvocin C-related protein [Bacteroidota bacterium]